MHPKKAEALSKLADASHQFDAAIDQLKDDARHPERGGWPNSLRAIATLPIIGVGAVLVDASEILVRRVSDSQFERDFPSTQ